MSRWNWLTPKEAANFDSAIMILQDRMTRLSDRLGYYNGVARLVLVESWQGSVHSFDLVIERRWRAIPDVFRYYVDGNQVSEEDARLWEAHDRRERNKSALLAYRKREARKNGGFPPSGTFHPQ